jgi:hypothetical protein
VKSTLLTSPLTPEQEASQRQADDKLDKAVTVALDLWLEEYRVGGTGLERMCRKVRAALVKIGASEQARHRILGEMLDKALEMTDLERGQGKKGNPMALQKTTARIVVMVAEREGLPKSREPKDKESAFVRTAAILADVGFEVSPETVRKWYAEYRDLVGD